MRGFAITAALAAALFAAPALAQETGPAPSLDCDDASLFGASMFTDICWDCIFPIRIGGVSMFGGGDAPSKATNSPICICNDSIGVPHIGVSISMWEPSRLTEIVRAPGCSPVLGGIKLPASGLLRRGTQGEALHTQGDKAFYNYHTWSFPLLVMLDLFVVDRCVQDGYLDLDLMYLSELDPPGHLTSSPFSPRRRSR